MDKQITSSITLALVCLSIIGCIHALQLPGSVAGSTAKVKYTCLWTSEGWDGSGGTEVKIGMQSGQECVDACLEQMKVDTSINGVTVLANGDPGCFCELNMTTAIPSDGGYKSCFLIAGHSHTSKVCDLIYEKVGCYHDKVGQDRPLPIHLLSRQAIHYGYEWPKTLHFQICKCAHMVMHAGYQYFGIQYFGECWTGPKTDHARDGPSKKCMGVDMRPCIDSDRTDCAGEAFTNYVYRIKGNVSATKQLCHPSSCKNNGHCVAMTDSYKCACDFPFTGKRCEEIATAIFYKKDSKDHKPITLSRVLKSAVTACSWIYSVNRPRRKIEGIFSIYSTPLQGCNTFLLGVRGMHLRVIILQKKVISRKIRANTWYHTCVSWNGHTAKLYINGSFVHSAATPVRHNGIQANKILLGQDVDAHHHQCVQHNPHKTFHQKIAEFYLWDKTLLGTEVIDTYHGKISNGNITNWEMFLQSTDSQNAVKQKVVLL